MTPLARFDLLERSGGLRVGAKRFAENEPCAHQKNDPPHAR